MSASPAQHSGPNSVTPNTGAPAPVVRKKAPVSIFNNSKKKAIKKASAPPQRQSAPSKVPNGLPNGVPGVAPQQQSNPASDAGAYDEFPIVISRRAFEAGQRFHAMKLQTRLDSSGNPTIVDPYKTEQFTRPLRLHRRFARDKMETAEQSDAASGMEDKEREQMNARRLERQAEREENQKLIAPTGGDSGKAIKKKPQKKVEEGRDESNPVRRKRQQLRYEEARPWHLEDFEAKNVWVGSYEDALSERNIMFEITADGGFKMVPIEKWYRFTQANRTTVMSQEDIEKYMQKKVAIPRWGMGTQKDMDEARVKKARVAETKQSRADAEPDDDDDPRQLFGDSGDFQADRDMLDMEFNDEFQDDDEGMLYQADEGEDAKEIEQRLWLEMRDAGLSGTGVKDEDIDPEEEERKRQLAEEEQKKKEKKLKKQLMRRENKGEYLSDDDSDPFDDSSEEEEEAAKGEEQKTEEAKKQINGDKSGASSRGTNTPSERPEKRSNPDMSDLSGNESSRKRVKGLNGAAIGRSLSPDAAKIRSKPPRSTAGSGSGSDTDTSRAGRSKMKLKSGPNDSRSASRAASPSASGSRAQSPRPNGAGKPFPTLEEVKAAIPPGGIEIRALVALFKAQVNGRNTDFIKLVKTAGVQDKASGKIMPKPA